MFKWMERIFGQSDPIDITEAITINAEKLNISNLAIEKAAGMIAKAIAKSEFKVVRNKKEVKDSIYWMLNVQPNENENATFFWEKAIKKALIEGECLILHLNGTLHIVESYQENNMVLTKRTYNNIVIESEGHTYRIDGFYKSDQFIKIRSNNKRILNLLKKTTKMYNEIASGLCSSKMIASAPKMTLDIEGVTPVIRRKKPNGEVETISLDVYKEEIKKLLMSSEIEILTNQNGLKINPLKIEDNVSIEDLTKIEKEIFIETAEAFDIPKAAFLGEISEKADSTNEFITYAVSPIIENMNDEFNSKVVGKSGFLNKDEKVFIDITRYKHRDIIESADKLDKLRAIGFTFDEILEMMGRERIETKFSTQRAITKNYLTEGEKAEGN